MNKIAKIALLSVVVSLAACGEDIPSVEQGKKALEAKYESSGCLQLISFEKTDGQKIEFGGMLGYKMKYISVFELKTECYGYYRSKDKNVYSNIKKGLMEQKKSKFFEQGLKNIESIGYKLVQEGEKITLDGALDFEKTEKGWHAD